MCRQPLNEVKDDKTGACTRNLIYEIKPYHE